MKKSKFLESIAVLTPYQRKKLEMYVIDACKLNDENKDTMPD